MKITPNWLEEILESKLVPLDRHPFLVSAILTSSIMVAASFGGDSFDRASDILWPHLQKAVSYWSLILAVFLGITALLLDFLVSWVRTVTKHLWWHIPCLFCLIVLICFIFAMNATCPESGNWFFAPFLFMFIAVLRFEPKPEAEIVNDSLHRKYLVGRVAELLQDSEASPKRIAIMGSWGLGKTVFLRLLRAELDKSKNTSFHMAWVNPWRSQTPEQAWAAIAKSIDHALGNRPAFPRDWANHPILVWLLGLIPSSKITPELVEFFANDVVQMPEPKALQTINRTISSRVGKEGRLIIFVDDMERGDPKVVRSILPVVDRLSQIEQSLFLFAIDPERISEAFNETEQNAPLTKGYIDKVFDLQIPLPEPDQAEILAILLEKAKSEKLPFLSTALPSLASHLPSNPRTALRFYEVAKTRERMFFARYHSREIPEAPFFLCWLIETEFPGFMKAILRPTNLELFGKVCEHPLMEQKEPHTHEDFPTLIDSIGDELGIKTPGESGRIRIHELVSALTNMSGSSLDWITEDSKPFTLEWIAKGHTRLDQLTIPELIRLRSQWCKWAGKKTLDEMLLDEFEDHQFSDASRCGEQLIDAEIKLITSACRSASGTKNIESALSGTAKQIDLLTDHLRFSRTVRGQNDLTKFNGEIFYRWLRFLAEVPLDEKMGETTKNVEASRTGFHKELARILPYDEALRASWWGIRNEIELGGSLPHMDKLREHCEELKRILMINASDELLTMFRDGRIAKVNGTRVERNWPPPALPSQSLDLFLNPRLWIPTDGDEWRPLLKTLVSEAAQKQNIAAACAEIIGHYVIHPSACKVCMNGHVQEREFIKRITEEYPGYFKCLWDGAMKLNKETDDYDRLIRERKRAEVAGLFDSEFFTQNFPLPHENSGGEQVNKVVE
ncbi:MAG: P-loop NTPase fold protein [Luteolibacter sp.]